MFLFILILIGIFSTAHTEEFLILRSYKEEAAKESFEIRDYYSGEVILSVPYNSGQENFVDWNTTISCSSTKLNITVNSLNPNWSEESYLFVYTLFSNERYELISRIRYDSVLKLPSEYIVDVAYIVSQKENWYYKMSEIPTDWYSEDASAWELAHYPQLPSSQNQIQLFKRSFSIDSLDRISSIDISLQYMYACIVYINGVKVFQRGFNGPLSLTSFSSLHYDTLEYHSITLPLHSLQIGSNWIAIGVVAESVEQTDCYFDCTVRLIGMSPISRVFDYTVRAFGISGPTMNVFNHYKGNAIYSNTAGANYLEIQFLHDRHEWISSIGIQLHYLQNTDQPHGVLIQTKNAEDEEWTLLREIHNLEWVHIGEFQRIWLLTNQTYNQYRFENFTSGDASHSAWKLGSLFLNSDDLTSIPPLVYPSPLSFFVSLVIEPVYPSSDYYTSFSISPPLPEGITLNSNNGILSGIPQEPSPSQLYTITAIQATGIQEMVVIDLSVVACTGSFGLIHMGFRIDAYPERASYCIYEGVGTTGIIVHQNDRFDDGGKLIEIDFCLPVGLYTLQLLSTSYDGWINPGGFYLSVDQNEMKFELGQVPQNQSGPASVTTVFSSYLPFQIEYDDWKVYKDSDIDENWNTIGFDDSSWTVTKAAQIGTNEAITTYIRREVTIPSLNDYHILNIRVKYAGGVVVYFNGNKVARFNLIKDFNANTESIVVHDASVFSQFHIILSTVGAITGKNVIAFEIHRPTGQSSSEPVIFDATGVFGVNDYAIGVDSVIHVSGTTPIQGSLEDFFDLTPETWGFQPNEQGVFLSWEIENLEGSAFNAFGIQAAAARYAWNATLYCGMSSNTTMTPVFIGRSLEVGDRTRTSWETPLSTCRYFKWEVDKPASNFVHLSAYLLQYKIENHDLKQNSSFLDMGILAVSICCCLWLLGMWYSKQSKGTHDYLV